MYEGSMGLREAISLFVDGLPLEMTWDWLQQIFRGEGDITDVYVSKKKRRNRDCRFGFVRFKKVEEAEMAIRNLNGVMIRGKIMKVSFAKYGKNGRPWTDVFTQKEEDESMTVGRAAKVGEGVIGERSFKDVVKGLPRDTGKEEWEKNNRIILEGHGVGLDRNETDMKKLKEMTSWLADEVSKATNREEVIHCIGGAVVEMINVLTNKFCVSAEFGCCRETDVVEGVVSPAAEKEEQVKIFWEEDLLISMMPKQKQDPTPHNDPFEFLKEGESVGQSNVGVLTSYSRGRRNREVGLVDQEGCSGPLSHNQPSPSIGGASGLGFAEFESSGPNCPPGFEFLVDDTGLSRKDQEQCMKLGNGKVQELLVNGKDTLQNVGEDSYSISASLEKVPQTPVFESELAEHIDEIEEDLTDGENLVEARVTWDLGKALGLRGSNEKSIIDALAKMHDCQDLVLPRRRGRPRKVKACKRS